MGHTFWSIYIYIYIQCEQFEGCPHYITVTEEESGHGANKLMHYRQKASQFFQVMGKVGVALNTRRWDALALASNLHF